MFGIDRALRREPRRGASAWFRFAAFAVLLLPPVACSSPVPRGAETHQLEAGGRSRRYHVVGARVRAGVPDGGRPIIIMLHGFRQTPRDLQELADLERVHGAGEAILVYPEGVERSWNDGDDSKPATTKGVDDLAFLTALLDDLGSRQSIDEDRIYAVGFSNGGFFLLRNVCMLSERLAAIAVVAAGAYPRMDTYCGGYRTVATMVVLGTEDPLTRWDGWNGDPRRPSATGYVLSRLNACAPAPDTLDVPDMADDGTRVRILRYTGCRDESQIVFAQVDGGGHAWPGGRAYLPAALIGATSRDWDASTAIADFFEQHRRRVPSASLSDTLRDALAEGAELRARLTTWLETPGRDHVRVEWEINRLGYSLLREQRASDAVDVFRLGRELFPGSFNVHDSLGEALAVAGRAEEAIASYRRSLEIEPGNTNAAEQIARLQEIGSTPSSDGP